MITPVKVLNVLALWVQRGIWCVAKYLLTNETKQAAYSLRQGGDHAHG